MRKPASAAMAPTARPGLLLRVLDGEALIYDFDTHQAHCLNPTAHAVFARCDGRSSPAQIARGLGTELGAPLSEEVVRVALDELAEAGLLVAVQARYIDLARRRVLAQVALTAGLSVALPAVWSIVAPTRADAASKVSCIPVLSCMTASNTCCGTAGAAAMSCSGISMCVGTGAGCVGATCI